MNLSRFSFFNESLLLAKRRRKERRASHPNILGVFCFCIFVGFISGYNYNFAKGAVTHANFSAKRKVKDFEFLTIHIFLDAVEVIKAIKEIKD